MGSVAKNGFQGYMNQLQKHPLRTKAITAGVLSAISDVVSQKLSGFQKIQLRRLLLKVITTSLPCLPRQGYGQSPSNTSRPPLYSYKLFGVGYLGPFGHYMHMLLDNIFKGKKDSKTVAKKVVLEQLTVSPINNLLFMIYFGVAVEGRPWIQVRRKLIQDYPAVQLTAWTFWPVFGWINHRYIPLQMRVIFQSLIAFGWGIFMNLRARSLALTKA